MKPIVIIVAACLALAACTTTKTVPLDKSKIIVIDPPKVLFNCPQLGEIPDPKTLTNKKVAEFIAKLYKYNKVCKINMDKIEKYIEEAKKIYNVK